MAGNPLPIVFKGTSRLKLVVLAVGIVLIGIGIVLVFDQDGGLVGPAGPFRQQTRPSAVGWMVCGTGLAFTVLALVYLARDCPRLELNDEGILYTRCLGTTRVAWSELDHAELRRHTETRGIGAEIDYLMLVATDGREVVISGPVAPTNAQVAQLYETITRVAARGRSTRPVH